jgi:hypothetical protein
MSLWGIGSHSKEQLRGVIKGQKHTLNRWALAEIDKMNDLKRYIQVIKKIRKERGDYCECCGLPATHGHHIIPVSETSIHSELVFEPANILILCDDCHALMHPLLRNVSEWGKARTARGQMLNRPS